MSFAPISMKVGDSIAAYRIVRASGAHTVAACSATTDIVLGITQDQGTKANQAVPVQIAGIGRVYCNDTIAAGALFQTNAAGQAVPFAESTAGTYAVGVMLETVTATGTIAQVLIRPQRLNDVP